MWPIKLDMTRDECRGVLRRLELESYSSVMSTFRAQGGLCKEKARILEELRKLLHISQDRHKAEARRVANDERLTTVAEVISGPNSVQDWCREGRRTFPILPRTAPYTALTYIANTVCEQITRENAKLPHPFETSQNRLEKEQQQQEEEKKKALEQQQKTEEQNAASAAAQPAPPPPAAPKMEVEPAVATAAVTPAEPVKSIPPPPLVVMLDPFVEAANKSYINNDLKRSYPVEPSPVPSIANVVDDDSPLKKKPQLYQELQKQEPSYHPPPIVTFHTQPYQPLQFQQPQALHFPLPQQLLSPNKNLPSPTTYGPVPVNNNLNIINNNNNTNLATKPTKASAKNTERQRKTSGSSKKNQNKTKTPYQTKQSVKAAKNMAQQAQQQQQLQQQQQQQQPIPIQSKMPAGVGVGGGTGKGNNVSSPHLIHSYASPLIPYEIPQHHGSLEMPQEPLQLQKHLTSNIVYQTQTSVQQSTAAAAYGSMPGMSIKSQHPTSGQQLPYNVQQSQGQPSSNLSPNVVFGQQQILPSSKKDIQYNLTKLNPTNNVPIKNNVNIPLKPGSPSMIPGKGHPLLNYQKKSPSKNVLIPTSTAAATLASLGIPKTIQRKDSMGKSCDSDLIINPADIPNPKIIFSTSAPVSHQESSSHIPPGNQITILDQITLHPPNTIIQASTSGGVTIIPPSSQHASVSHITPNPPALITNTMALNVPISKPVATPVTPVANKVVTLKGPNLAGFTPVKSGSKLSVHKLQLMPIGAPGSKNNVILLPAKGASSGTLNPGQKITIPKSVVETNALAAGPNILSPPKVIVQQQPDINNIVVFDIGADQKLKTTNSSLVTMPQKPPPPANKSVITEDTPVDIVSTPLDVVTGAVKLQELSKGFLSPASTSTSASSIASSPLTERMVKPQQQTTPMPLGKYNNAKLTKATKFEADSTAPGPSVTVTKKSKANHQGRGTAGATTVQNSKSKSKPTPAAASSTTAGGADASQSRTPAGAMSSTDWELELDQANQVHNLKSNNVMPKAVHKPAPKSNPPATPTPIAPKPVIAATPNSNLRKPVQPLSSSSISSTSTPVADKSATIPNETARLPLHRPVPTGAVPTIPVSAPAPVAAMATPPKTVVPLPPLITTSPPNERSDDTSATDSADAEEDPEVEEDDDCEAIEEEMIIDEEHFNDVIEEDPDPDETFNEQEIHGERVEIVSVGYDTSRALIADLEGADGAGSPVIVQEGGTIVYGKAGNGNVEINPSSMNFVQYIEEAGEGDGDGEPVGADPSAINTRTTVVPGATMTGNNSNNKNMMFEMTEIDADGNKHTRTVSYEEMLAEGQIMATVEEPVGKSSTSGTGTVVKGKTKSTS